MLCRGEVHFGYPIANPTARDGGWNIRAWSGADFHSESHKVRKLAFTINLLLLRYHLRASAGV